MFSLSVILICITINTLFLILVLVGLKQGWVTPAITQALLSEMGTVISKLVSNQVSAKAVILRQENEDQINEKAIMLHQEIDSKIEAKSADLETKMAAKIAAMPVRIVSPRGSSPVDMRDHPPKPPFNR